MRLLFKLFITGPTCQDCFTVDLCSQNNSQFQLNFSVSINQSLLNSQPNPTCDLFTNHRTTGIGLHDTVIFQTELNTTIPLACALCMSSGKAISFFLTSQLFENAHPCTTSSAGMCVYFSWLNV